jgi:hypothetical protein
MVYVLLLVFAGAVLGTANLYASTWTVDAVNGTDSPTSGSTAQPFQTLGYAWPYIQSGDTVLLKGGTNGTPNFYIIPNPPCGYFCQTGTNGIPQNVFNSWTYFVGDSSSNTIVETGSSTVSEPRSGPGTLILGVHQTPNPLFHAYMNWSNVTFNDGILNNGASDFTLTGCRIIRQGPLRGDVNNLPGTGLINNDKAGIFIYGGQNWTVNGCEITQTGFGIEVAGSNDIIENNVIHDVTQDGCDPFGVTNLLIQGNTIYNCDDGMNNGNPGTVNPLTGDTNGFDWDRHCDGIQYFMTDDNPLNENSFITIRGNNISAVERACIQGNNFIPSSPNHNHDITIENNIFGPNCGVTPIIDSNPVNNFVIRFNTNVYVPQGVLYTTQFRSIGMSSTDSYLHGNSYSIEISGSNVQVYDNLLGPGANSALPTTCARYDHNVFQYSPAGTLRCANDHSPLPRGSLKTGVEQLLNPVVTSTGIDAVTGTNVMQFNGILTGTSVAINAGTRLTSTQDQFVSNIYPTDYYGMVRHNTPTVGAVEISGSDPTSIEMPVPLVSSTNPTSWTCDFANGLLSADPVLNTGTSAAIGWTNAGTNGSNIYYLQNYATGLLSDGTINQITEPSNLGTAMIFMNDVPSLLSFKLSFNAGATASANGGGPIFLYSDASDFCWLCITNNSSSLHQTVGGVDGTVLKLPWTLNNVFHHWTVTASQGAAAGMENISVACDSAPPQTATVNILSGPYQMGLYRDSTIQFHRLLYNSFQVMSMGPVLTAPTNLRLVPQ